VVAYELLFRSGLENVFSASDGEMATSRVISDSLLVFDSQDATRGKRAFINFTRDFLLGPYAGLLPKEWLAVEILETVEPDAEVVAACQNLEKAGYFLVLDDFVYHPRFDPLLKLSKVVKLDILALSPGELALQVQRLSPFGVRLLAEKVETQEEFERTLKMGFSFFQGYFFSKPVVVSGRDVQGFKLTYLRMLQEINKPDIDFPRLEKLISQDVSLSYKLLRYINSVGFGLGGAVKSIRQALTLLGQENVQKWASLVALTHLGQEKPDELLVSSIVRAKFCESLAPLVGLGPKASHLFLVGLFSHLDALLDQPLDLVLEQMPIDRDVKAALAGKPGPLGPVYQLCVAYARGDWEACAGLTAGLGLAEEVLPELYLAALQWSRQLETT
jgi:EAL and modified HD-GYP domain-containing signal transduction protein